MSGTQYLWPVTVCVAPALLACGDPVRDSMIADLGPEPGFVSPGPLHRPGQPCLLCHRDGGSGRAFSVAGTVFANANATNPAPNVTVYLLDSTSRVFTINTNCAGNFYVWAEQFAPSYPMWVSLRGGSVVREMDSPIYREGSCGGCHGVGDAGPTTPGHVYFLDDPMQMLPPNSCGAGTQ